MNADRLLKTIDGYLSQMKSESDKLSQFYSACLIAREALHQVKVYERQIANLKGEKI